MVSLFAKNDAPLRARLSPKQHASLTLDIDFSLNLFCLDGFRCLVCFAVVLFHVHFVHGSFFYLSTEPCFAAIRQLPFGNLLFDYSFQMSAFWIISGFLCERQLHRTVVHWQNQGVPKGSLYLLVQHMVSRLLRLYPVYFLMILAVFLDHAQRQELFQGPEWAPFRCDAKNLWHAATFTIIMPEKGLFCAGTGWTLQIDMHGHLIIALLFALTHSLTYCETGPVNGQRKYLLIKQLFWLACYAMSIYQMLAAHPFPEQGLQGATLKGYLQSARMGLDLMSDRLMAGFGLHEFGFNETVLQGKQNLSIVQQIQNFRDNSFMPAYFSGLGKHGGAIFLGSLLYMRLYERQGQPCNTMWKLGTAASLLYATDGSFVFSGVAMYLMLDVLLTFQPTTNLFSSIVNKFLASQVFRTIAPYTFGIYMFHFPYLFVQMKEMTPLRVAAIKAGQDACNAVWTYDWKFLLIRAIEAFTVALVLAYLSRYTIEYPFTWIRERYVKQKCP